MRKPINIITERRFRSWSRFLAVSLQVMWVINPAVGCHYFPPGQQLPPQPFRGLYQLCCLVNRGTMGVNSLPKTVTRQRRDCDLNPCSSEPESSTLTTWLPSHPFDEGRGLNPDNSQFFYFFSKNVKVNTQIPYSAETRRWLIRFLVKHTR